VKAVDTFFGAFVNYLTQYDPASLLRLIDCLDTLEEELQAKHDITLQIFPEYVPCEAIRNYWHTHAELSDHIAMGTVPEMHGVHADLPYVCLMKSEMLEKIIAAIDEEYREDDRLTIEELVYNYGDFVNLGHILFNIASMTMGKLLEHGIEGTSKDFRTARESIIRDPDDRKPITFSGWFEGDPELICSVMASIYEKATGKVRATS